MVARAKISLASPPWAAAESPSTMPPSTSSTAAPPRCTSSRSEWHEAFSMDAAARIKQLREEIAYHNHRYYTLDDPELRDAGYGALMRELQKLESENPQLVTPDS